MPRRRRSIGVPATALAVGSLSMDPAALYEFLIGLVPEADQVRMENLERALSGVLLGQDLRGRISRPGPGSAGDRRCAPEDAPRSGGPHRLVRMFPTVLAVEIGDAPGRSRTRTARRSPAGARGRGGRERPADAGFLACLDEKNAHGHARIVTRKAAGARIVSFEPPLPFAYAVVSMRGGLWCWGPLPMPWSAT